MQSLPIAEWKNLSYVVVICISKSLFKPLSRREKATTIFIFALPYRILNNSTSRLINRSVQIRLIRFEVVQERTLLVKKQSAEFV